MPIGSIVPFGCREGFTVDLDRFFSAALVLLGHGSTQNAESETAVLQHADALRRRRLFRSVREAFWKQAPQAGEVMASLEESEAIIVPMFVSEGYFSEDIIPRKLGFQRDDGGQLVRVCHPEAGKTWHYSRPVGTHPGMTAVLLARAREIVEQFPFPCAPKPGEITLFIAGHGTEQNANSRAAIERQADLIRAKGVYAGVHAVFMEESPRIRECYSLAATRHIVVVPFFMSDGLHVREDIPVLLGEPEGIVRRRLASGQATWRNPSEKMGKLVWYTRSASSESGLVEVILDRARETLGH